MGVGALLVSLALSTSSLDECDGPRGFLGNPQCGCSTKNASYVNAFIEGPHIGGVGSVCTKTCKTHADCEPPSSPEVPQGHLRNGVAKCAFTDGKTDYCALVVTEQSSCPYPLQMHFEFLFGTTQVTSGKRVFAVTMRSNPQRK